MLNSIKSGEREKRGSSLKMIIKSKKSRLPRDFNAFLRSGDNKARMIDLLLETITYDFKKQPKC